VRFLAAGLLLLVAALPAAADHDFLTPNEVDQVREAQEPSDRLKLYILFARQRIDVLKTIFGEEKAGRSALIHDTLEDYSKIIEAIDTVADDALKRKKDIAPGMEAVAKAEREMAADLRKFAASQPKDLARYRFVLDQAIETTEDSAELSASNLQQRAVEVQSKEAAETKEREAMMRPEDVKAKKAAERKEAETKRKAPTLLKKGEKLPGRP